MFQFSAYWMNPDSTWMGVHRLPLDSAIHYCQETRRQHDGLVALVPDGSDPEPYFKLVESLA